MSHDETRPSGPPILRPALFLAALGLLVVGLVPDSVLRSVLTLREGGSTTVLLDHRRSVVTAGLAILAVLALLAGPARRWLAADPGRLARWLAPQPAIPARREVLAWGLGIAVLVAVIEAPALFCGYFEADDFTLLSVDSELSLGQAITTTHVDHTIPLLRLETRIWRTLFGAWAPAYTLAAITNLWGLAFSLAMLLRLAGTSRVAMAASVLMLVGWTPWGVFTSGCYILQKYAQIAVAGMLGSVCWLALLRTGKQRWACGMAACVAWSCSLNMSGFYVPLTILTVAAATTWSPPFPVASSPRQRAAAVAGVLAVSMGLLAGHFWIFSLPGNTRMLSAASHPRDPGVIAVQTARLAGSAIVSLFLPVPHHLGAIGALRATLIAAGAVTAVLCLVAAARTRALSGVLVAAFLVTSGIALLVSVGRPDPSPTTMIPPKYLGPIVAWVCLLIGAAIDGVVRGRTGPSAAIAVKLVALIVALSWAGQTSLCLAHLADVPYFRHDVSRIAAWRIHRSEAVAIADLRSRIFLPIELSGTAPLAVPDIPGEVLRRAYPALDFTWGECPPLSFFRGALVRNPSDWQFLPSAPTDEARLNPLWAELCATDEVVGRLNQETREFATTH